MMGVGNRVNTAQMAWDWATVTSGAGTDSITWAYNWGTDSLILGENFVCAVPLEDQAATTNNLGLGTPFAGNLEVYPVYRMAASGDVEESARADSFQLTADSHDSVRSVRRQRVWRPASSTTRWGGGCATRSRACTSYTRDDGRGTRAGCGRSSCRSRAVSAPARTLGLTGQPVPGIC